MKRHKDRKQLAEHVGKLISKDRNDTHGDPHVQFECAGALKGVVTLYDERTDFRSQLDPTAVEAREMILTKLSRLTCGSNNQDAWLDIAGYALIAAEKAENKI